MLQTKTSPRSEVSGEKNPHQQPREVNMTALQTTAERPNGRIAKERIKLASVNSTTDKKVGSEGSYTARVHITDGTRPDSNSGRSKSGPFDAIAKAIGNMVPHGLNLCNYSSHGVTGGTDASAEVTVVLADSQGNEYAGSGTDTDSAFAFAIAYISAINQYFSR